MSPVRIESGERERERGEREGEGARERLGAIGWALPQLVTVAAKNQKSKRAARESATHVNTLAFQKHVQKIDFWNRLNVSIRIPEQFYGFQNIVFF